SLTTTSLNVTLPSLITVNVYVITSPASATPVVPPSVVIAATFVNVYDGSCSTTGTSVGVPGCAGLPGLFGSSIGLPGLFGSSGVESSGGTGSGESGSSGS